MYCRNCGNELDPKAVVCVKCGVYVGTGEKFCQNCGGETLPGASVCTKCGAPLAHLVDSAEQKSRYLAGLFAFLLGLYGVHNFYLGYTTKAIIQLVLTITGILFSCCFGLGSLLILAVVVWTMVEGILLFCEKINCSADGIPLKNKF